jgi:Holliday junction DNA helicase RuvA
LYAYLRGEITYKTPTYIHLENNGIGYLVHISLNTFGKLENVDRIKLYTYVQIKEDSHTLYGFAEEKEKEMFTLLISVSGIGANTARVILSSMTAEEVKGSILNDDNARFNAIKGIGPKTAQRLIIDLKDKVLKTKSIASVDVSSSGISSSVRNEAIAALISLGFQRNAVTKKVDQILTKNDGEMQIEDVLKQTLKLLS